MKSDIQIYMQSNANDYRSWFNDIPRRLQLKIKDDIPKIRKETKKIVKAQLTTGHGVEQGIYRKSFIINNFAESPWHIGFQVFAKKPHYRLTHLLEGKQNDGRGHKIKIFKRGQGERTKWGNIGMVFTGTKRRPSGWTYAIKHIEPGQEYADEAVPYLYRKTYTLLFLERTKKL